MRPCPRRSMASRRGRSTVAAGRSTLTAAHPRVKHATATSPIPKFRFFATARRAVFPVPLARKAHGQSAFGIPNTGFSAGSASRVNRRTRGTGRNP